MYATRVETSVYCDGDAKFGVASIYVLCVNRDVE